MPWASLRRSFPQAKCGPSVLGVDEMSVALSQRLRDLRHRLAETENLQTIADIRRAAMRFAERNDLRRLSRRWSLVAMRSGGAFAQLQRRGVRRLPTVRPRCRPGSG